MFAHKTLGTDQIISCGTRDQGLFLSSRIEHRFVYGNRWLSVRFRPLLGAASSGTRPWPLRHPASRTGRGTVGRRRVRVRVHSTLVLSRVGKDKSEPHLTQGESGPSSDPRTPRRAARSNRRGASDRLCVSGLPSSSQAVRNSSWARVSPTLVSQARAPGSLHGTKLWLVAAADARKNASRQPVRRSGGGTMRPPTIWATRILGLLPDFCPW